jgi:hypothetical protein
MPRRFGVSKRKIAAWLPVLISMVALIISLGTLYYDHWREAHSLTAVIAEINWGKTPTPVEIVFRNLGNKSEVLKDARLIWNKDGTGSGEVSQAHVGPLVVKPDESIVQTFEVTLPSYDELRDSHQLDQDGGLHVGAYFSILDFRSRSKGEAIYLEKTIPFTVIYFDQMGRIAHAKPGKERVESFVDLYTGSPIN